MIYRTGSANRRECDIEIKHHVNPATGKPQTFPKKVCKGCLEEFQVLAPSHLYCSQSCAEVAHTDKELKRKYNISFETAVCMFEAQEGRCAICGERGFRINPNSTFLLCIDHCHDTGKVRGMLCHNCNRALGLLQENIESLKASIKYLESATTIS